MLKVTLHALGRLLQLAQVAGPPYAVPGTKGVEIIDALSPMTGEYRVVKPRFSAFFGTELELILRRLGADSVVVCGTQYPEMNVSSVYVYNLVRDKRFDALSERLVIDWGAGTRSWVQNFKQGGKEVVEVLPKGYVKEFPGFLDFILRFDELKTMIETQLQIASGIVCSARLPASSALLQRTKVSGSSHF
ncbi:MAG: isochorismatase family protein [Gallionella sp.]|nr:isochorismatase family protein [Gallionella sp.]